MSLLQHLMLLYHNMELSPRLKKITELAGKCDVVADIGTDHALVPVFLVENGLCQKAYACDVASEPLKRAGEYVASKGLSDKIKLILTDGLENVPPDTDKIIIAGMGGELIASIIAEDKLHKNAEYILQPMSMAKELRKYLYDNGFEIIDEVIVSEHNGEKLYCIINAHYTGIKTEYEYIDLFASKKLIKKTDDDTVNYLFKQGNIQIKIAQCQKISEKADKGNIEKSESVGKYLIEISENNRRKQHENTRNI